MSKLIKHLKRNKNNKKLHNEDQDEEKSALNTLSKIKPNSNKKRLSLNEIAQIDFDETKDLFKVILKKFTVKVCAVNSSR
jgi:hypothetical protein